MPMCMSRIPYFFGVCRFFFIIFFVLWCSAKSVIVRINLQRFLMLMQQQKCTFTSLNITLVPCYLVSCIWHKMQQRGDLNLTSVNLLALLELHTDSVLLIAYIDWILLTMSLLRMLGFFRTLYIGLFVIAFVSLIERAHWMDLFPQQQIRKQPQMCLHPLIYPR